MNILKTRTVNNTWNGRPGTLIEHHLDSSRLGLRISVFYFNDSNDVDVKLVKGDGRTPKFQTRAHLVVTRPEIDEAVAHLARNPGE